MQRSKQYSKLFIVAVLVFFSTKVVAEPFSSSKVTKIVLHDWGMVIVSLEGQIQTNVDCPNKNSFVLKPDHMFFKEMYAALLAAYQSETRVAGWFNGCDSTGMPILNRLDLMPKQ